MFTNSSARGPSTPANCDEGPQRARCPSTFHEVCNTGADGQRLVELLHRIHTHLTIARKFAKTGHANVRNADRVFNRKGDSAIADDVRVCTDRACTDIGVADALFNDARRQLSIANELLKVSRVMAKKALATDSPRGAVSPAYISAEG